MVKLKADRKVVLPTVKQQDMVPLRNASAELKADRNFMLVAVRQHGWALVYASAKLRRIERWCWPP